MNLPYLAWRNLVMRPLASLLSLLLLSLGVGLILLAFQVSEQFEAATKRNLAGIDVVVGAKGSPLQLLLSAIYHVDNPTGNIPFDEAERLSRHPWINRAIPLAYGDNYRGYRILGTTPEYIDLYGAELATGKLFTEPLEVVAGAEVAAALDLEVGATFVSTHNLQQAVDPILEDVHDEHPYQVVGILAATGTVVDGLLLTPVASQWLVHEHSGNGPGHEEDEPDQHAHAPDSHPHAGSDAWFDRHGMEGELTAALFTARNPAAILQLPRIINDQTSMQAAVPQFELRRLNKRLGVGVRLLEGVALAIVLVSALSVFVSLYNSLRERRYELALMRTLGASRSRVLWLILLEGLLLAASGALLGVLFSRMGLLLLGWYAEDTYRYSVGVFELQWAEVYVVMGALMLGVLAALLPALRAYRLDLHESLTER